MNERMNENYSYYKVYLYVWHKKFDPVRFITKLTIVYNLKYLYADKFEKISIEVKWGGGHASPESVMVLLLYLQPINFFVRLIRLFYIVRVYILLFIYIGNSRKQVQILKNENNLRKKLKA